MDGNLMGLMMFMAVNMATTGSALFCGWRSWSRHRRAGRAVLAAIGGLFIVPALFMIAVAAAAPRPHRARF